MEQKPFAAFLDLVTFDQKVHLLQKELSQLKITIDTVHTAKAAVLGLIAHAQSSVDALHSQVQNQEREMQHIDHQEKEKRKKLEFLSEYREIKALNAEIDQLKHTQMSYEQQLIQLWNKLEHAQKESTRVQTQQGDVLHTLNQEEMQIAAVLDEKMTVLTGIKTERPAKEAVVPHEWLEHYTTMSARVSDPVVPVERDSCSACYTAIAKQDLIRLFKRALVPCRLCFRMLYCPTAMRSEITSSSPETV